MPRIAMADALAFSKGETSSETKVFTAFPCSDLAFQVLLQDGSNSPRYERGDAVVIDPAVKASPGDMVLAAVGKGEEVVFRRYRLTNTKQVHKVVLEPLNSDWPTLEFGPKDPLTIIGVRTEHTSRRP